MAHSPLYRIPLHLLAWCLFLALPSGGMGQHFTECVSTISNATVLIPKSVSLTREASPDTLSSGDEIALFTDEGTCVGVGRWDGKSLAIVAAGANPQESSGYAQNEPLNFRLWDASAETTSPLDVVYAACKADDPDRPYPLCRDDGQYETDALYVVSSLSTDVTREPTVAQVTAGMEDRRKVATNTRDDDLRTRWSAYGQDAWIQFDLREEVALDQVGIAWYRGDRREAKFEVAVSADGTTWTTVHQGWSSGTTQGPEYYGFSSTPAKHVRIRGRRNTENRWTSITEVKVGRNTNRVASKSLVRQTVYQPIESAIPVALSLEPNYPNPVHRSTTIRYAIPERGHVTLEVFDLLGRRVARPVDRLQSAGHHEVTLTVDQWSSGTYLYRLQAGGETQTGRMTIVR